MKKTYFLKLLILLLIIGVFVPFFAKGDIIAFPNPLEADSFIELVEILTNLIFTLSLAIAPIMIIVAGFYFITAAGDPAKITVAKQIILWTLIGLIIVISARGIIELFKQIFWEEPSSSLKILTFLTGIF